MNASQAAVLADRRKVADNSTVDRVVAVINTKVETAANLGHRDTLVTVPSFVMNVPQYDHGDMVVTVMAALTTRGYYVVNLTQGRIYVSWRYPQQPESFADDSKADDCSNWFD